MRNEDRNSKTLARMIRNLTGDDIGKHAVFAKFAMQSAQDKRGGAGWSPSWSKSGMLQNIANWGLNKIPIRKTIPQDFGGMAEMVSKSVPSSQQVPSILDQAGTNPYVQATGGIFSEYGQQGVRSAGRGMFSGEQDNKVTSNPLDAIGQDMVKMGINKQ